VNDYGRPQNDIAAQDEQAHELIEHLNLLEAIDRRITPEHVAKRFSELLDNIGSDGLPPLRAAQAQAQAAEIVACARDEAAVWMVKAERAASEADAASQKAQTILADAGAYADTELQRAASMVADARRQAKKIIADAEKDAGEIMIGAPAARGTKNPAAHDGHQPQTAVMTAQRSSPRQFAADEPTAAAKLTISLLPYQPGDVGEKTVLAGAAARPGEQAVLAGKTRHLITIIGGLAGAIGGIAVAFTHSIGGFAVLAVGELVLMGAVLTNALSRGLAHQGERPPATTVWKQSREGTQNDNCRNW
jgi:hypothetical protein